MAEQHFAMPNNADGVMPMLDVAIIGAGLSGLSLAEKLLTCKPNIGVFEARERYGGTILSAASPAQGLTTSPYPSAVLAKVYDACADNDHTAALFGFFGLPAEIRQQYHDSLPALIVWQIVSLFGPAAANPLSMVIQDWSLEPFTATSADRMPVFEYPVHGHRALQLDHWQDKLYFCGTDTASKSGGYLEGALDASDRVYTALTL